MGSVGLLWGWYGALGLVWGWYGAMGLVWGYGVMDYGVMGLWVMVVAVGYAMVINMMSSREVWPFFFLGFALAAIKQFDGY